MQRNKIMSSPCIYIPIPPTASHPADPLSLDARLRAALPFLRGGTLADVGTDHAYLPIAALQRGLCDFAVATDIHRGPATIAAEHLAANGIGEDKAVVLLTDGLHGAQEYHPTDICIFGMGGEMISHIIDEAPWVRDASVRLVLQPMTKQDILRDYLDQSGFHIIEEYLVKTDRIYTIICAEYDGHTRSHTPLELLLGKHNLDRRDTLTLALARRHIEILTAACEGKRKAANPDLAREDALLQALHNYLEQTTED
jgi:tRNA (adenine22-N1)-methyltransferase